MLIVRGVNVFPSALRELVDQFAPAVSGVISIRPARKGARQSPPLKLLVERGPTQPDDDALADRIAARIRETLLVNAAVSLVPFASLPRSDYKSKLVDWSEADEAD